MLVESTDLLEFDDLRVAGGLDGSSIRGIFTQGTARPDVVVIVYISNPDLLQTSWTEHDDMVQALASDGPDDAFRARVLLLRTICCKNPPDAESLSPSGETLSVNRIAITGYVHWLFVHAATLNQLLCTPSGGWMVGYIEMQDPTTGFAENDEHKKDVEADCWYCKEVE